MGCVTLSYGTPDSTRFAAKAPVLRPNQPNPFNPTTTITFELAEAGEVTLAVYNLLGQQVAEVVHGPQTAGTHSVRFDGSGLPSGVYIYQLRTRDFVRESKMLLLK